MNTTAPVSPDVAAAPSPTRRARFAGVLATCAGADLVAMFVGVRWQTGYLVIDRTLAHSVLLTALAVVLLGTATYIGSGRAGVRALTVCLCGLMLAACLIVSVVGATLDDRRGNVERFASPAGDFQLVVREGGFMDPVWYVSIERPAGLLSRAWDFGCFNGDAPPAALRSARWLSDSRVRLTTWGTGHVDVTLDEVSGKPARHVARGEC